MKYVFPTSGQAYRQDTNGNSITYSGSGVGLTDTMGRVIPSIPAPTSNVTGCPQPPSVPYAPSSAATWNPPGVNGGTYPILFCYVQLSETNPIGSELNGAPWQPLTYTGTELQSVVLPNGTSWTFEYTTDGNADLSEVIFPTGGTLSYGSWQNLIPFAMNGSVVDYNRAVGVRTLNPNDGVTPPSTWTYDYANGNGITTVSSPPSSGTTPDDTVHTFAGPLRGYETQTQYYQGSHSSGTLLKTTTTQYLSTTFQYCYDPSVCTVNVMPSQSATAWPNGQQNKTTYAYDSGVQIFAPQWYCNPNCALGSVAIANALYGKVLTKSEYDYGNGAPGPLLRTTTTNYLALNNPNYLNANLLDPISSTQIKDGGGTQRAYTTYSYDEPSSPVGAHGNLTSTHRWLSTNGTYLFSSSVYDSYGRVTSSLDPNGNSTGYGYSSSSCPTGTGYAGSAPTSVTNALSQTTYSCYDLTVGLATSVKDPNSQTTSYTYDNMLRTTSISFPDTGAVTFNYPTPTEVDTSEKITSTVNKISVLLADGLGRLTQTRLTSDPDGVTYSPTQYDGLGRKYKVWNPTRCSPATTNCGESSWGYTTTNFDALGRPTSVTKQDGSVVHTAYCGSTTLVTDEAAHWRRSTTDGLGRVIEVDEPNSTSATVNSNGCRGTGEPIWVTTYAYDALDDLTGVTQGGSHQRTFVYDSLKRLASSTNPEPGSVSYTYDADGNVLTKTDARSIITTYSYDALNRTTGVTYSNGDPAVAYTYDQSACLGQPVCYNIGRRTSMTDAAGSENFSYDKMGHELTEQRTTNSVTKTTSYTYDLAGDLATLAYPSGRIITYTPDTAGRPSVAQDVANGITYASGSCANGFGTNGACYAPSSAVAQMQNGTNLVSTFIYNSRLQPCWLYATTGTALPTTTTCTGSASAGNVLDLKYNFSLGAGDDGNVMGITNDIDGTRSQVFTYDQLNRIMIGETTSTYATSPSRCWGESYTLDQWANLTAIGVASSAYNGCTQESLSVTAATNNRLSSAGFSYDLSGNTLADGVNSYAWNAESEMKSAAGVNYTYDGDGNRVQKSSGKIYWYGAGTEILDESDANGNFTSEYVFFGGKRIARRDAASGNVFYYADDMLGSTSKIVQDGQTTPCYDADFYPFGGERVVTSTCPQSYKFEGKERDTETGNDDFGARYYTSRLGRWLSADWSAVPAPIPYANLSNPQTLNLYAMVSDNPETFADLDGHFDCNSGNNASGAGCLAIAEWNEQHGIRPPPPPSPTQQQAQNNQPAPTNPDGTAKPPTNDVPKLPDGKPPGWKPGDPLVPNEWEQKDPGKGNRDKWGPKYPIPGGSQPGVSWDPEGHWDHDDGNKNRTRWLPGGGGQVGHNNNPMTMMDRMRSITPGPIIKLGAWGIVAYIIVDEGSRFVFPARNLVPVP
ncbi:MAG: hypothetical protein LAN36_11200 [Acidobacteriia bacterium]|nr:hypothetical protein [Terriglobia bacterium]